MAYRILSLDGGGVWALLEAIALSDLYQDAPGHEILSRFDVAAGTSGGAIVLAGLIENKRPSEIAELFRSRLQRTSIFARVPFGGAVMAALLPFYPKYSTPGKLAGLTEVFGATGQAPLSELVHAPGWPKGPGGGPVKIMITAFDYDMLRAALFRSYDTKVANEGADKIKLVEAVHASSNAPVRFFNAPTSFNDRRYWDGAMGGLNNPLMVALSDLLAEGAPASEIAALSMGTGTVKLAPCNSGEAANRYLMQELGKPGVLPDLAKAAGCVTDDPPDTASFMAHVVLSAARGADIAQPGPLVRLSPVVRPILDGQKWVAPEGLRGAQFKRLANLDMDAVEKRQVALLDALGEAWLADRVKNQPIKMNPSNLSCEIGDDLYSLAKARWLQMAP